MKFGKVIGQIISTQKTGKTEGLRLAVVRYLNDDLEETPYTAACIDTVQAGDGDIVLLCASSSARMTKTTRYVCTDNTIVAIVDVVSSNRKNLYTKSDN